MTHPNAVTEPARAGASAEAGTVFPIVVTAFGTTVAMWCVAWLAHLPALHAPPALTAAILLAILFFACTIPAGHAGRGLGRALVGGVGTGVLAGLLNLLILGSKLTEAPAPGLAGVAPSAPLAIGGFLATCAAVGAAAGGVGRLRPRWPRTRQLWLHRFAAVAAAALVPLVFVGGLVTSTGSGMAFPDWPTSDGALMFLYPLRLMTGGAYYEHTHRLFGALVGLTTLALLVATLLVERRVLPRLAAATIFAAVCVQGLLGGLRVNLDSRVLALIHGISGQLIFAGTAALATVLAPRFLGAPRLPSMGRAARRLPTILLVVLTIQLSFGAVLRHLGGLHAMISHVAFSVVAAAVAMATGAAAGRLAREHAGAAPLRTPGKALIHATGLQMILGLLALWMVLEHPDRATAPIAHTLLTTAHQINGAILLVAAAIAATWTVRLAPRPR